VLVSCGKSRERARRSQLISCPRRRARLASLQWEAPGDRVGNLRYIANMSAGKLRAVAGGLAVEAPREADSLIERLKRGELSIDDYLELQVDAAIAPLRDKLPADRIEWMRAMLKEQLREDPVLSELVRQATGREPQAG
jgi:hypothetical protein